MPGEKIKENNQSINQSINFYLIFLLLRLHAQTRLGESLLKKNDIKAALRSFVIAHCMGHETVQETILEACKKLFSSFPAPKVVVDGAALGGGAGAGAGVENSSSAAAVEAGATTTTTATATITVSSEAPAAESSLSSSSAPAPAPAPASASASAAAAAPQPNPLSVLASLVCGICSGTYIVPYTHECGLTIGSCCFEQTSCRCSISSPETQFSTALQGCIDAMIPHADALHAQYRSAFAAETPQVAMLMFKDLQAKCSLTEFALRYAESLVEYGKNDDAVREFENILTHTPNSLRANIGLARLLLGTDPLQALVCAVRAIQISPRRQSAWRALRDVLMHKDAMQQLVCWCLCVCVCVCVCVCFAFLSIKSPVIGF